MRKGTINMQVRHYMTHKIFTIRSDKKLFAVQEIMKWAKVRHVPVVDQQQRLIGMISHRDLLHASISLISTRLAKVERQQHLWDIPIQQVMRSEVTTVPPEAPIQMAARLMRKRKIGCLPVVSNGKLVGLISEYDLLQIVETLQN
jgi:CBS domain-containing membrane protein